MTTDNIKDLFCYTFYSSYCLPHLRNSERVDAFRIELYVTTFYMQHFSVARFVIKQ